MNVPGIHEFLSSRMVKSPQLSSEWLRTNDLNADKKLRQIFYIHKNVKLVKEVEELKFLSEKHND